MIKVLLISAATLTMINVGAWAQNPPGSIQQDRGIREDLGRPGVVRPRDEERPGIVEPGGPGPTVGEGRPRATVPGPPGSDWQDKGINEDAGKRPDGRQ
jgi:hypothetical protein